mmetsp:Transcript_48230/g.103398  ORF Transcript_48230/g.103398 Transcript_48230/m.103398 type:complete len:248 (+) Transcript_48230:419-1162(+)
MIGGVGGGTGALAAAAALLLRRLRARCAWSLRTTGSGIPCGVSRCVRRALAGRRAIIRCLWRIASAIGRPSPNAAGSLPHLQRCRPHPSLGTCGTRSGPPHLCRDASALRGHAHATAWGLAPTAGRCVGSAAARQSGRPHAARCGRGDVRLPGGWHSGMDSRGDDPPLLASTELDWGDSGRRRSSSKRRGSSTGSIIVGSPPRPCAALLGASLSAHWRWRPGPSAAWRRGRTHRGPWGGLRRHLRAP